MCGAVTVMRESLMVQTRVGGVVVVAAIAAEKGSTAKSELLLIVVVGLGVVGK